MNKKINKNIQNVATDERLQKRIKKHFSRISKNLSTNIIYRLLQNPEEDIIYLSDITKKQKATDFIRRNRKQLELEQNNNSEEYYIKKDCVNQLRKDITTILSTITQSVSPVEDDSEKFEKKRSKGKEIYVVNDVITFQEIRKKVDQEGRDVEFVYDFENSELQQSPYQHQKSLQRVNVHVNSNGEKFPYPLIYHYTCTECGEESQKYEYEVASTNDKIKCESYIETENSNGEPKIKRCNQPLSPDSTKTESKEAYLYEVTTTDNTDNIVRAMAFSFRPLPKGKMDLVLVDISRPYERTIFHIVDYKEAKSQKIIIPENKKKEHYLFTLTKAIDNYILQQTGYSHYGFLPVKFAMVLQMIARYNSDFSNNFNISLTGDKSSGKTQFARYWGIALYSQDSWMSNATSISIPKLRGTMETLTLFNKEYRYQDKGLFGEKDLIVIDELKENPDLKKNIKQYGAEPNYDYSKQGSSNQKFTRTSHLLITQNVDTKHLQFYARDVKKEYESDLLHIPSDKEPKPAWDSTEDLTLPLHRYKNRYLKFAIKRVRDNYAINEINWIEGNELALKQRFYLYFYLGSSKQNKQLTETIRGNTRRKLISDDIELQKVLNCDNLKKIFRESIKYTEGKNEEEYQDKVDNLLKKYEKLDDARTKGMSYKLLQLIRIADFRNYYKKEDIEIFQYLLECLDNKIEVVDTHKFSIHGPLDNNVDEVAEATSFADFQQNDMSLGDLE